MYKAIAGNGTDNKSYYDCCCGPLYGPVGPSSHVCVQQISRTNQHISNRLLLCIPTITIAPPTLSSSPISLSLLILIFFPFLYIFYRQIFGGPFVRPPHHIVPPLDSNIFDCDLSQRLCVCGLRCGRFVVLFRTTRLAHLYKLLL